MSTAHQRALRELVRDHAGMAEQLTPINYRHPDRTTVPAVAPARRTVTLRAGESVSLGQV